MRFSGYRGKSRAGVEVRGAKKPRPNTRRWRLATRADQPLMVKEKGKELSLPNWVAK